MTAARSPANSSGVDGIAAMALDLVVEEDPLNDAFFGYPGFDHRLGDLDEASQQMLRQRAAAVGAAARRVDRTAPDWVTAAVAADQADGVRTRIDARLVEHTMVQFQTSPLGRLLGGLPMVRPVGDPQQWDFLVRLASIPRYLAQAADRHRGGIAAGRTPVAERVQFAIERIDGYLADPGDDPLCTAPLADAYAAERARLLDEAVRPALVAYRDVLRDEIAPHGRGPERLGLCWLPDGEATYAALAQMHTTTALTPEDLHAIGVELVEALDGEYRVVAALALGVSDPADARSRMRTDRSLRWSAGEDLVAATCEAVVRAEQVAPAWFGLTASHPCSVEPAPEVSAPNGYYAPPALDGSRPGTYYVNAHRPKDRARFVTEANAFHEAVPGHHLQLTVAQELKDLPPLRRLAWINSYIEGWGLYVERLADEMGLYSDHMARLGMLAMDSMRAARLVVDTGIHAFGWSRQRAVDYLRATTVSSDAEIGSAVDRYVEWPGQALSYMVGRLELQRLRDRAERQLGNRFDIRAFHDAVLGGGALPMAVLDDVLDEWARKLR